MKTILISALTLFITYGCNVCKDCDQYDNDGNPLGSQKMCGKDLKEAEKDSSWVCQ